MRFSALALTLSVAFLSQGSAAAGEADIGISARARTVCTASFVQPLPTSLAAGASNRGRAENLCNNLEGFQLILEHPRGLQNARIILDGTVVTLSETASSTVVLDSPHPVYAEHDLTVLVSAQQASSAFELRAEARGQIF